MKMNPLKRCFLFLVGFLTVGFAAVPGREAVAVGEIVLSATPLVDVQRVVVGYTSSGDKYFCSLSRSFDGKFSVLRGEEKILLHQDEIPGGYRLTSDFGCFDDTVIFIGSHPTQRVGSNPALALFVKSSLGVRTLLEPGITTFEALNPRNNQIERYVYNQAGGFDALGDRIVIFAAATPPQIPGVPGPAAPQAMWLEFIVGQSRPSVLFNNTLDASTTIFTPAGFCVSQSALYVLAQFRDPAPPSSSRWAVVRIQAGRHAIVKPYTLLNGRGLACLEKGVQIYAATDFGVRYSFIVDNSGTETELFAGSQIDGIALHGQDRQVPISEKELYVLTNSRHLMRVETGSAKVLKRFNQSPVGNSVDIAQIGEHTLYIQREGNIINRSYWLLRPRVNNPIVYGRPGDVVVLFTKDAVIEGRLPSLSFAGFNVSYSPSTDGTIRFTVPANAVGELSGIVDVFGIQLPIRLVIGSPKPIILAVAHGGNFRLDPLAPGQHATLFGQNLGRQATPGFGQTAFSLGGARVFVGGKECRLYYNSGILPDGSSQINFAVPQDIGLGEQPLQALLDDVVSDSITITIVEQSLAPFTFSMAGQSLPILTNQNYELLGNPALGLKSLRRGDAIIVWATGGGATEPLVDERVFAPAGPFLHRKPVLVALDGQQIAPVYSGRAPGFANLDQIVIFPAANISSGRRQLAVGQNTFDVWIE